MNLNTKSQHGSVQIIIISLLSFGLILAVGWIFWQNFLQPKAEPSSVLSLNSEEVHSQDIKSSESTLSAMPADPSTYITIDEWGIKFKLSEELKATKVLTQKISVPVYQSGIDVYYGLTTEKILTADETCIEPVSVSRSESYLGEGQGTQRSISASPISGYYYYSSSPSAGTPTCNADLPDIKPLLESLKTLQAKN